MSALLLGILLVIWSLMLLGVLGLSNTVFGIFVLIVGIVWIVSALGFDRPLVRR